MNSTNSSPCSIDTSRDVTDLIGITIANFSSIPHGPSRGDLFLQVTKPAAAVNGLRKINQKVCSSLSKSQNVSHTEPRTDGEERIINGVMLRRYDVASREQYLLMMCGNGVTLGAFNESRQLNVITRDG